MFRTMLLNRKRHQIQLVHNSSVVFYNVQRTLLQCVLQNQHCADLHEDHERGKNKGERLELDLLETVLPEGEVGSDTIVLSADK